MATIVVAWMYNTNGMASWCWEAAHALHEARQPVLLVCHPAVQLPEAAPFEVLYFETPQTSRQSVLRKIKAELDRLSPKSCGFVHDLHSYLVQQGVQPSVYLLNQTNLQDPHVPVPQYVTGWAYPISLRGYCAKTGIYSGGRLSRDAVRSVLSTVGWWGKDWRGYRSATGVLSVSRRLDKALTRRGVNSHVVHPGSRLRDAPPAGTARPPYKLLTVALDLEDPRKRVKWLVEALHRMPDREHFSLTLVGRVSKGFEAWASRDGFPATFTGSLPRADVQTAMAEHDIFLFGSALDDWGYVLVEAMSNGLCAVAPRQTPFDEIVGDTGVLFEPDSAKSLCSQLNEFLQGDVAAKRAEAYQRATENFSRAAFAHALLAASDLAEAVPASGRSKTVIFEGPPKNGGVSELSRSAEL